jgi:hypothetical protein
VADFPQVQERVFCKQMNIKELHSEDHNNHAEHVDTVGVSLETSNHVDRNYSEIDRHSAAPVNTWPFVKREISLPC